ncbi:hypothetical protein [Nitrincola sp. A-D6]|uniref:hypothetical protein n=1 Tax=Nitrincola sp. A-D6 TaxID=1545442 RepID=UPI0013640B1C|nr:hypothetical protein [Nitrincola sp. A-D6]
MKKELAHLKAEHERLLQENRYAGVISNQPREGPMDTLSLSLQSMNYRWKLIALSRYR